MNRLQKIKRHECDFQPKSDSRALRAADAAESLSAFRFSKGQR
jgi:hypothetical protein